MAEPPQERQYSDPAKVRAKLERIGRALVAYRQDYPAKPVSQWQTYTDAGLPRGIRRLTTPGKAWTINADDLHCEPAISLNGEAMVSDFSALYRLSTPMLRSGWPAHRCLLVSAKLAGL